MDAAQVVETSNKVIKKHSLNTLNEIRYNISSCSTNDAGKLHILLKILEAKSRCHDCYVEWGREEIINIIKRYI